MKSFKKGDGRITLFDKREEKDNFKKAADRLFLQSFIISIISVLLAIMSLSAATWAWFTSAINSDGNTIELGYCEMSIGIGQSTGDELATISLEELVSDISLEKVEFEGSQIPLEADTAHVIAFVPSGTASTCYCQVTINGNDYFTEQISVANGEIFAIELIAEIDSEVEVLLRWGTGIVERDLKSRNSYIITADGIISSNELDTEENNSDVIEPINTETQEESTSAEVEMDAPESSSPDISENKLETTEETQETIVAENSELDVESPEQSIEEKEADESNTDAPKSDVESTFNDEATDESTSDS